jgi:NTE family protein
VALACLKTALNNANRYYLTPEKAGRTIFVDSTGISATDFDITAPQRAQLFGNGQTAAQQWLKQASSP